MARYHAVGYFGIETLFVFQVEAELDADVYKLEANVVTSVYVRDSRITKADDGFNPRSHRIYQSFRCRVAFV